MKPAISFWPLAFSLFLPRITVRLKTKSWFNYQFINLPTSLWIDSGLRSKPFFKHHTE